MGTAIVATAPVSDVSALIGKITNLQFGEPYYYLLQRSSDMTDWKKGYPDAVEISRYAKGRLFGRDGEVRWKKTTSGYLLLWLSEGDLPKEFTKVGKWQASAPQKVFLLGGGDTDQWQDTRISRKLNYPMKQCESPQVRVIPYKDLDSQTIRFTRYTEFVK